MIAGKDFDHVDDKKDAVQQHEERVFVLDELPDPLKQLLRNLLVDEVIRQPEGSPSTTKIAPTSSILFCITRGTSLKSFRSL